MNSHLESRRTFLLTLILSTAIGCSRSKDDLPREAVAGIVTLDTQPLIEGVIQFTPTDPNAAATACVAEISDGKFSIPREDGLVPGSYRISISHAEMEEVKTKSKTKKPQGSLSKSTRLGKETIPARYNTQSTIKEEIKRGGTAISNSTCNQNDSGEACSETHALREWRGWDPFRTPGLGSSLAPTKIGLSPRALILVGAEHLAAVYRSDSNPRHRADRVLHEVHRPVAEQSVHSARVPASRADELAPLAPLAVTREVHTRLAVAEAWRNRGARAGRRPGERRQVVHIVPDKRAG